MTCYRRYFELSFYKQCLLIVVLNDDQTEDIPQSIQEDVSILHCFKNKLLQYSELNELKFDIYHKRINECEGRCCSCSRDIDCECEPYNDYEIWFEEEWTRLKQKEEDIETKLDELESDMKQGIPSRLQLVAQKLRSMLDYPSISAIALNFDVQ